MLGRLWVGVKTRVKAAGKPITAAGSYAWLGNKVGGIIEEIWKFDLKGYRWGIGGFLALGTFVSTVWNRSYNIIRKSKKNIQSHVVNINYNDLSVPLRFGYNYLRFSTYVYMVVGGLNSWLQLSSLTNHEETCDDDFSAISIVRVLAFNAAAVILMISQMESQEYWGRPQQVEYYKKFIVEGHIRKVSGRNLATSIIIPTLTSLGVWYANPDLLSSLLTNTWLCRIPRPGFLSDIDDEIAYLGYALSFTGCLFNLTIGMLQSIGSSQNVSSGHSTQEIERCYKLIPSLKCNKAGMFPFYGVDSSGNFIGTVIYIIDLPKRPELFKNPYLLVGSSIVGVGSFLNLFYVDVEGFRKEAQARYEDLLIKILKNILPLIPVTESVLKREPITGSAESMDVVIQSEEKVIGHLQSEKIIDELLPYFRIDEVVEVISFLACPYKEKFLHLFPHEQEFLKNFWKPEQRHIESDHKLDLPTIFIPPKPAPIPEILPIPMTTDSDGKPIPRIEVLTDEKAGPPPALTPGSEHASMSAPLLGDGKLATPPVKSDSITVGIDHTTFGKSPKHRENGVKYEPLPEEAIAGKDVARKGGSWCSVM